MTESRSGDGEPGRQDAPPEKSAESIDFVEQPDYRSYSLAELRDVRTQIDPELFADRLAVVDVEIALRLANPGVYEPEQPDNFAVWRKHWPRIVGILGLIVGLASVGLHGAGMAAVFKAKPEVSAGGGGTEKATSDSGAAIEASKAGAAGTEGSPAGRDGSGTAAGESEGEAGEEPAVVADQEADSDEPDSGTTSDDQSTSGGGASKARGRGAPPKFYLMPMAATARPGSPRWYLAWSAGTRFAGIVISLVLLWGAFQLVRRREAGTFWFITAATMAFGLNVLEQVMMGAALGASGTLAVGLLLGAIGNGALVALVMTGARSALR